MVTLLIYIMGKEGTPFLELVINEVDSEIEF